ncbi:hypothetical protein P7K49_029987 [Saguinus oedipus]|uniref:Uncharacterized protein n=1 Tax=Saguinus oedipus TaxID=9490 RepID=A0ABQ9U9Z9_SAGOE|nr:hypothetical protein P7K49_029987 [Saguinus oedipus]
MNDSPDSRQCSGEVLPSRLGPEHLKLERRNGSTYCLGTGVFRLDRRRKSGTELTLQQDAMVCSGSVPQLSHSHSGATGEAVTIGSVRRLSRLSRGEEIGVGAGILLLQACLGRDMGSWDQGGGCSAAKKSMDSRGSNGLNG